MQSAAFGNAAVMNATNAPFEIMKFPLPKVEPGAILVKIKMTTICGTDIHRWKGEALAPTPTILGHESTGVVYELGDGVNTDASGKPLRPGDRIAYSYIWWCGHCYYCRIKKEPNACTDRIQLNGTVSCANPPHFNGSFGEYLYLRPGQVAFKVSDELPDELVAPLNCGLSTVMKGLERVGVEFGDRVVVQGAGALGLYATALAKEMGASKVIVIDLVDERLRMAEEFGADYTINALQFKEEKDRINEVKRLTNNNGADLAVEVAGIPTVIPEGLQMLRRFGRYLEVGCIGEQSFVPINVFWILRDLLKVVGTKNYEPETILKALEFLANARDRYPFEKLVTYKFPLAKINEAFKVAAAKNTIRVALTP